MVFLDITASSEKRDIFLDIVRAVADQVFIPFAVGGGVRTVEDYRSILLAGADKVAMNTAAFENPAMITEAAEKFGSQCVVVAIDAKKAGGEGRAGYEVFSHSATRTAELDAVEWAQRAAGLGAGELLVTSIDRDGTKLGYDVGLLGAITSRVPVPVVASGGAGKLEHFYDALGVAGCDAALAASLFHYRELTVRQVKDYLAERGVVVRP